MTCTKHPGMCCYRNVLLDLEFWAVLGRFACFSSGGREKVVLLLVVHVDDIFARGQEGEVSPHWS